MAINIDYEMDGVTSGLVWVDSLYLGTDPRVTALEGEGFRVASAEETARLRVNKGVDYKLLRERSIFGLGNFVKEGFLYKPAEKRVFFTKKSPILRAPGDLRVLLEEAFADSVEIKERTIPTNRFGETDETAFLFGDVADDYGRFLRDVTGLRQISISPANVEERSSVISQVWLDKVITGSGISDRRNLFDGNAYLRGIKYTDTAGGKN